MSKPRGGCKLIIKTVNDKITSYFPPSPLPEDEGVDSELDNIEETATVDATITEGGEYGRLTFKKIKIEIHNKSIPPPPL